MIELFCGKSRDCTKNPPAKGRGILLLAKGLELTNHLCPPIARKTEVDIHSRQDEVTDLTSSIGVNKALFIYLQDVSLPVTLHNVNFTSVKPIKPNGLIIGSASLNEK
jgi:hypothetical protein